MQGGSVWKHNCKQFALHWKNEDKTLFFIPQNFWNQWGDQVQNEVVIMDTEGNCFKCRIRQLGNRAYFRVDFTMKVVRRYHIIRPVRVHFEMINGDLFLMRITIDGEGEISYPRIRNGGIPRVTWD